MAVALAVGVVLSVVGAGARVSASDRWATFVRVEQAAPQQEPGSRQVDAVADRVAAMEWLSSDRQDEDRLARASERLLRHPEENLTWLRAQWAAAKAAPDEQHSKAVEALATGVLLSFIDSTRRSGMVYRGQYEALARLQPYVADRLFELLLRTPDWFADSRRVELVQPLFDLQMRAPTPAVLLGVVDLVKAKETEPEDLRLALSCLVWQWGRKEFVRQRVASLREQSSEGSAEERVLAMRQIADLWYRVAAYDDACRSSKSMIALASGVKVALSPTDWYWSACYYSLSGDVEKGLRSLERCLDLQADKGVDESKKLARTLFESDPEIALLRADARFVKLVARAFDDARGGRRSL